jgi:hypothetical protein
MVRIAQTIVAGASEYERKAQRLDFAGLSAAHSVTVVEPSDLRSVSADVIHIYGPATLSGSYVKGVAVPFVTNADVRPAGFMWRKPSPPAFVVTWDLVPEAVEEKWFQWSAADSWSAGDPAGADKPSSVHRIGSFDNGRPGVRNMIEQTLARIHRFRDDVEWQRLAQPPSPEDLTGVDVWVDPATSDTDLDGFVAEAYVAGKPLVASRTAINTHRLEKSRCGFLVPLNDPNELGHAILTALFKPEVARLKNQAARQTAGKFRPRQRLRVLERMYETLIP